MPGGLEVRLSQKKACTLTTNAQNARSKLFDQVQPSLLFVNCYSFQSLQVGYRENQTQMSDKKAQILTQEPRIKNGRDLYFLYLKMGQSRPLFLFSSFPHDTSQYKLIKSQMVGLELESIAAGWKSQTNPLSYGSCYLIFTTKVVTSLKSFRVSCKELCYKKFKLIFAC